MARGKVISPTESEVIFGFRARIRVRTSRLSSKDIGRQEREMGSERSFIIMGADWRGILSII